MMLEIKKLKLEKMKVECAKEEMEVKILEHEENIKRLKDNMKIQDARVIEIDQRLKELQ